jgi:hypothetical protein
MPNLCTLNILRARGSLVFALFPGATAYIQLSKVLGHLAFIILDVILFV